MNLQQIKYSAKGSIGIIEFNRPQSMNAVNSLMLKEITKVLNKVKEDESTRAMVLTGGEKVFSAGFDIKEIAELDTPVKANRLIEFIHQSYAEMASVGIPVIAAVSGLCFGGGFELALTCDFIIASQTATFALPEINLGLMPGAGGTQRLPRMIGTGRALEMLYTGQPVSAQRAFEMGLVNQVTHQDELVDTAEKTAKEIAARPGFALKLIKKAVKKGVDTDLGSALDYEARCFEMLFSTKDQKEGVHAFINKRRPEFKGY